MKAFPYQHKDPTTGLTTIQEGMTLRDYFAAKAMQGIITTIENANMLSEERCAKWCYEMADAMLKEREQ